MQKSKYNSTNQAEVSSAPETEEEIYDINNINDNVNKTKEELASEIEAAFEKHRKLRPHAPVNKKEKEKKHLSKSLAWTMIILTLGSTVLTLFKSMGLF